MVTIKTLRPLTRSSIRTVIIAQVLLLTRTINLVFITIHRVVGDLVELMEHKMLSKIVNPDAPGHDKKLKIIGRRNQAFKTPQGEFIVPETLENHYISSPFIFMIYVHAERIKDH